MSDPAKYRSREEVAAVREKSDPIEHTKRDILAAGAADEAKLKDLEKEVRAIVADAADFAESPRRSPTRRNCLPTCWWGRTGEGGWAHPFARCHPRAGGDP